MAKDKVTFSNCESEFIRLSTDIDARKYAPIYLFMGEESYFIDALCNKLSDSILNETERSFDQIILYGRDTDGGTVASYCRQLPMMGKHEVIIVKEAQALNKDELNRLSAYTSKPQHSTILIVCHKEKPVDKRSAFFKSCVANGEVLESVHPYDNEIKPWLKRFIEQKGFKIDQASIDPLVWHLGTDISRISNEITKLTVSLPVDCKCITADDIEKYIGISKLFNNFELSKAITEKNLELALTIADHISRDPKNPLLLTIKAIFFSFRDLFIMSYFSWQTKYKRKPFPSDFEFRTILQTNRISELKRIYTIWTSREVFKVLGLLREYEAKSKGLDTGGLSEAELLRELILKILM